MSASGHDARYWWQQGILMSDDLPLLSLLLLTEPTAEWVGVGLLRFAQKIMATAATGTGHGYDRHLSAAQVDGPLRAWVMAHMPAPESQEEMVARAEMENYLRLLKRAAPWERAHEPVRMVTQRLGVPFWPSVVHVARRMVAGRQSYRRRAAVESYARPLEQLGALDWRWSP